MSFNLLNIAAKSQKHPVDDVKNIAYMPMQGNAELQK